MSVTLNKHYAYDRILAVGKDIGEGYKRARISLGEGDTAYYPGSSKHVFVGPGAIAYTIHAMGWTVECDQTVTASYRKD